MQFSRLCLRNCFQQPYIKRNSPRLRIKNSATQTKNRPSGVVAFAVKLLDGVLITNYFTDGRIHGYCYIILFIFIMLKVLVVNAVCKK